MYREQIKSYQPSCIQERSDKQIIYRFMEDYPHNILTRDNRIAHMTSSGFVMNKDLTKVLVIFHKVYQSWGWTGGHADGDEDLFDVAMREAMEETGLKVLTPLSNRMMSIDILPVWGHEKKGSYVSAHLHLNASYVLIADEDAVLTVNEEETEGVMWVEADKIGDYSTEPDLVYVYNKLIKAARSFDPSRVESIQAPVSEVEDGFGKAMADTAIPIAVHEAKSAYYKAKLVKEVASHGGKAVFGRLFKKKDGPK